MQTSQIPGGIQPHSMGSLFPAVIARVERYREVWTPAQVRAVAYSPNPVFVDQYNSLAARLLTTSYELTLGDFCEEYATREDAELVARGLLDGVAARDPVALQAVGLAEFTVDEVLRNDREKLLAASGEEC